MVNKSALASVFDEVMEHHLAFNLNAQECLALANKFGLGPVSTAFLQETAALNMALANTALSCQPLAAIFVDDAGKRKLAEIMGQEFVPAPLQLEPLAQSWACPLTCGGAVVGTEYSRGDNSGLSSSWQQQELDDDTTAAHSVSYSPDSENMTGVSAVTGDEEDALQQLPDISSKPEPVSGLSLNTVGYNALPEDVTSGADGVMSWQHCYDTPWAEGFSEYLADSYTVKGSSEALVGDVFVGNELTTEPEPEPEPKAEEVGQEETDAAAQAKSEAEQNPAGKVKLPHGARRKIRAAKRAAKKAARREALLKAQAKQQAQQATAIAQQDKAISQVEEPATVQDKGADNSTPSTTEGVSVDTPVSAAADNVADKAADTADTAVGNEANSTTPENTPEGTPVDAAADNTANKVADTDAGNASGSSADTSAASQPRQGKKAASRKSTKQQNAATPAPDEPSREAVLLLGWMLFVLTYGNSALVGIQNALLLVLKTFGVIDLEDLKLIAGRKRMSFEKSLLLLEDLGKIALVEGQVVWLAPPDDFEPLAQTLYPLEEKRKNGLRGADRHLPNVLEIGALSEGLLSQTGVNILAAIGHYKAVNAEQLRLALRLKKNNFARAVSVLVRLEVLVEHEGNLYLVPHSKVKPTTLVNRYHKQQQEEQLKLQRQLQAQERAAQREAQKAAAAAAKEAAKAKAAQEKAKAKELAAKQKAKETAKAKKAKEAAKAKLKAQAAKEKAKSNKQAKKPAPPAKPASQDDSAAAILQPEVSPAAKGRSLVAARSKSNAANVMRDSDSGSKAQATLALFAGVSADSTDPASAASAATAGTAGTAENKKQEPAAKPAPALSANPDVKAADAN